MLYYELHIISLQNLEKLLTIPTGCGEQIMATLAPNLYILKYLNAVNNISPGLSQRAVRNIKIGYQRILDYIHPDGSFSAFGYHDPAGSMFLTSFVVRTLQQAKKYMYVDQNVINKAVHWILGHQLENGCFSAVTHVFQDMVYLLLNILMYTRYFNVYLYRALASNTLVLFFILLILLLIKSAFFLLLLLILMHNKIEA